MPNSDNVIHVEVRNPENVNRGVSHLLVNGVRIEGGVLPLEAFRKVARVVAGLGH